MQQRDSLGYTLLVAAILCVVCSLGVSTAAVVLKDRQEENVRIDQQKNILDATGLAIGEYGIQAQELNKEQIADLYRWISERLINMDTGDYTTEMPVESFDIMEAISDASLSEPIVDPTYNLGEKSRPRIMKVFFVKRPGEEDIRQVVLPVYGKGLWGTLYGFLAIKSDLETIQGLTFFKHKETPGLGGEVDNPRWKAEWDGVRMYGPDGNPMAMVYKGPAPPSDPYAVDGLSGATITSRGVTNLVRYWISDQGYGPFLKKLKVQLSGEPAGDSNG